MKRALQTVIVLTIGAALWIGAVKAQQPTPQMVIVQPAGTTAAATPAPAAAVSETAIDSAIKALEQVKATNEATLKKQEEMLQQLDELQKAAEQLKIFAKRV